MDQGLLLGLLSAGVIVLFLIGVPIFLVIGYWVVGASLIIDFTLANVGVTLFEGLNFFGLLSLPLFILTGDLIAAAGIARRLADFAHACMSWLRGGLGLATLGSCGLFAAISGSNSATTATIGGIMHPLLVKDGYDSRFAAATAAAGGTVGIIIPPSIIFIVYGFLMNLSISDLFVAGILPGALMVVSMMGVCWFMARRNGWGSVTPLDWGRVFRSGTPRLPGLLRDLHRHLRHLLGRVLAHRGGRHHGGLLPARRPAAHARNQVAALPDILLRSGQLTGMLAPMIAISIVMQQVFGLLGAAEAVSASWPGSATARPWCCWCAWDRAGRRLHPGEPAGDGDLRAHPGANRHRARRGPGALLGDLPGGRCHRLHHPAFRPQPVRGQRRHRHSVFEAGALRDDVPVPGW
jgi:C4-dicarboxylate transporter DctM subunit